MSVKINQFVAGHKLGTALFVVQAVLVMVELFTMLLGNPAQASEWFLIFMPTILGSGITALLWVVDFLFRLEEKY